MDHKGSARESLMRKEYPCCTVWKDIQIVLRVAPVLFKNAIASATFLSSVGRALPLHGKCRWFESSRKDKEFSISSAG
jgi:hypothetical protein